MLAGVPGSLHSHLAGEAEVHVLTKEEGGRHTPFASGYLPQFFFGPVDSTGTLTLPEDSGSANPGEHTKVRFELSTT